MPTAARYLLAAALVGGLCAAAPPRPRPDPDAMREARPDAPGGLTSARAIAHYLDARRLSLAGDQAGAIESLRLATAFDEQSGELHSALAEALALAGRVDEAEVEARQTVVLDPAGRPAAQAHALLGRILAARRQPDEALREFRAAMPIEAARVAAGGRPEPWRLAAELQASAGDLDGATATLEDGVARIGSDGGVFRELGRGFAERLEWGRAEPLLRRAVEVTRIDSEAWRLLAQVHEGLRRTPEARTDWLAALRLDPDDPEALLGLGRLALRDDEPVVAREWFDRFLRASPDAGEPRLRIAFEWLEARRATDALRVAREGLGLAAGEGRLRLVEGLALQELRRWDEAAAALAKVPVSAGETWFSARPPLAYALSRAGRLPEALAALDPALVARPGDARLVSARALVLGRMGRGTEAVEQVRAAVAERASDASALDELYPALAEALVRVGRAAEAVATLQEAVTARPRDEVLLYTLGAAYERAGRTEEAIAQMRALLVMAPDHAEALNFVGFSYAERGTRLDEAEELVRRAMQLAPRSGHMVDSLGFIRLRRGDSRQAVELLEEADRLSGPDPAILEHLGDAYRAAARPAEAAAAYRRGLKSFGDELPAEQVALRGSLERKLKELAGVERKPAAR